MDDPRQILSEAGVECVEAIACLDEEFVEYPVVDAAILALARLVAKYKWQLDEHHRMDEAPLSRT
jgi:hypothetical protein